MSEPVSALNHAGFDGLAKVTECGLHGMITLRGDLAARAVKAAATGASGVKMPGPNEVQSKGDNALCWMSPDELLVICDYKDVRQVLDKMHKSLGAAHALAVDMSDARTMFCVTGSSARDVMAKLTPADLSPATFGPGQIRRSRLAQIPAAFWLEDDQSFRIICFRSVAQYAFDLLCTAAGAGSDVGYFSAAPIRPT
ncbi:sarcosine oxidase subunit gamma [Pontibaca salina]|uniref:Sarcosine oxidase subunit gamma n=1 Tax=Pontibaca salina TaxID=2795731 RepID=A0A934M110_9RHOB|nr:sarcosine oxidase subunit gamma family protein [Pontibaca salina]MBI6629201.1 sarcosine oxidase subunit gamma [Pontibaca salina]